MLISRNKLTKGKIYSIAGESGTCKSWKVQNDVSKLSSLNKDELGVSYRYKTGPSNVETLYGNISVANEYQEALSPMMELRSSSKLNAADTNEQAVLAKGTYTTGNNGHIELFHTSIK